MTRFSFVLIAIVCIGISACIAFAEDDAAKGGTIRGKIVESNQPQNPIEGVDIEIIVSGGKKVYTARSNPTGDFECTGIPAGNYIVVVEKKGYRKIFTHFVEVFDGVDEVLQLKMINLTNLQKQRMKPLVQHVTNDIGRRYKLDKTGIEALRQSIHEVVEAAINHDRNGSTFMVTNIEGLEKLLSRPDCKTAFAKHLTEAQLQDCIDFTKARRHRAKQVILYHIAVLLDQELCLTVDQRKNIVQLLLDRTDALEPASMETLSLNPQKAITLVNSRLKIQLSGILTKTQEEFWQLLTTQTDTDAEKSLKRVLTTTEVAMQNAVDEGMITAEQAAARLDALKKQLGISPEDEKIESQKRMKQFLEAKLAVNTEMLGTLDEHASQRLKIATKGVVQQYLETKERMAMYREAEEKLMEAVAAHEITCEQADQKLGEITEELWGENIAYEDTGEPYGVDITNHPLYQKTIKEVLSEEAYAQYTARQTERDNFYQQTLRDLAVVILDIHLLLNDVQRKQLKTTAAMLTVSPLSKDASLDIFYQLYRQIDRAILSPWQQNEIELIFGTN